MVRSIHYASSFESLAFSGISFAEKSNLQNRQYRFLSVLDTNANLPGINLERKCVDVYREQLEPKGVQFDIISDPLDIPNNQRDYIWVNWSSHGKSSANEWGDSFLMLGKKRINALTIATEWQFDLSPHVILAACESAIDSSGGFHIDEYCGLDIAFQIAGARSTIASLWPVEDLLSALTAMLVPAWWFQGRLPPADSLTALQKALSSGTWKQFLLRDQQLNRMSRSMANAMKEVQEPFWRLREDIFQRESIWAAFRACGI
jgi:CHAT domain-containing protein